MRLSLEDAHPAEVGILPSPTFKRVEIVEIYHDPVDDLKGVVMSCARGIGTIGCEERLAVEASNTTFDDLLLYRVTSEDEYVFYVKLYDNLLTVALDWDH